MDSGLRLFRIRGIAVSLHYSWWFIAVLLAYSLAADFFPRAYPGMPALWYGIIGICAAVLLFACVLLHELAHALVAKAHQLPVDQITLFFFGGVASLPGEDVPPRIELVMALAGPLASLALAGALYLVHAQPLPLALKALSLYLWQINLLLALFNLVPGYPLDGGRVFRALLRLALRDLLKATRIAALGGKAVGGALVFLGFLGIFAGALGGIWFLFLGGFLWLLARASYGQVALKVMLDRIPFTAALERRFPSARPGDPVSRILALYQRTEQKSFVVVEKRRFAGVVGLSRKAARNARVKDIMIPAASIAPLDARGSAAAAYRALEQQQLDVLPVLERGRLVGVVRRRRLLHLLDSALLRQRMRQNS